jgi:hypothetical protein
MRRDAERHEAYRFAGYNHFVPHLIHCPKCDRTEFVRLEHVIKDGSASVACYCGPCEHDWIVAVTDRALECDS